MPRDRYGVPGNAYQANSRASFLADLTLDPPTSTGDFAGSPQLDEEYVVLSTIHSAKGCEWDVIYIIHPADGVLPSDMVKDEKELEEERRLLYVAMTRARDALYVTLPLKYYHRNHPAGDSYSTAQLTRFLPPSLFRLFERVGSASPKPAVTTLPNAAGETAQHVREIDEAVRLDQSNVLRPPMRGVRGAAKARHCALAGWPLPCTIKAVCETQTLLGA